MIPFRLELQLCGHSGPPDAPAVPDNRLILRDFHTGAELRSALPPRSDIAKTVQWDLAGVAGKKAYLEVVDGLDQSGFAWLGIGSVTPRVIPADSFATNVPDQLATAVKIVRDRQRTSPGLTEPDFERMSNILEATQIHGAVRVTAGKVLLIHHNQTAVMAVTDLLSQANLPRRVERSIIKYCIGPKNEGDEFNEESPGHLIRLVFAGIDRRLRGQLVNSLAATKDGASLLVKAIQGGTPTPNVLRDQRVVQQLKAHGEDISKQVEDLLESLPPIESGHEELAANVLRRLRLGEGQVEQGKAVFTKHCSACHQRAGEGGKVGPQLDGIATRGMSRLLEDILQPNLNVDVAFRTSSLILTDGRVVSGIVRPGQTSAWYNVSGVDGKVKEVLMKDVEERVDSQLSLMPANVATLLSEDEMVNLLKWLAQ